MGRHPPDPDQPVPLALAPNDFEAQVISQALNSEGVRAVVMGTHAQVWYGAGNPLAPVSVMVRRCDRMKAIRVLRRLRAHAEGREPEPDTDSDIIALDPRGRCVVCRYDMSGRGGNPICPECGTNLAEESAMYVAVAGPPVTKSLAFRILVLFFITGIVVVMLLMGLGYIVP